MNSARHDIQDYVNGPFAPHGEIELWREGSVIHLEAAGPFNAEAMQAFGLAMTQLLAELPPQGLFIDILELRHSMLASPEAIAVLEGFMQRMSEAGKAPCAVAYVAAPEVEGREFMMPLCATLYERLGRRFASFHTRAEADAWARQTLRALQAKTDAPSAAPAA